MYFKQNPPANQFLCRAYLRQGQLKIPSANGSVDDFQEAVLCFLKAIEISKQDPRYHFMVFNASVLYFQTVRPLLQPGRCLHLVPSLRQVVQSLEEVADQDHIWRAELMMHLIVCLMDAAEMEEAVTFAKATEEFVKTNTPHLYPKLFTLLVKHRLWDSDELVELSEKCPTLAVIYKIQQFKGSWDAANTDEEQTSTKLEEIFHLLVDEASSAPANPTTLQITTPLQPASRVAFLLELAMLALQVKHQKVAADCLKELKSAGEASVSQRIVVECVNCEINLLKKEAKMNDYSKDSVEARLKEIGRLDQWLQTAVREGGPQAVQAVCSTQWGLCLPLLQHNLKGHIKAPLLRLAQAMEDTHSMLLEMRCQVHSELARIEEEEGRLEAALTHLQKAMQLDNGTQRESLSSALHLVKLRRTLYQTPSQAEDKAAMLMQQARDMPPQNNSAIRPTLVSVGLLLAPTDFQMVLDADDTSKITVGAVSSGPAAQLAVEAQHHFTCVQKVEGHLARQGEHTNSKERMKLWVMLVKTARKQEVWDVCRAACRFCLLYDDGRWNESNTDKCTDDGSCSEFPDGPYESQPCARSLCLLAEIYFINAEATIQKLQTAGVQLNSPPVPPQDDGVCVSESDTDWIIYREWIEALSAYATYNFLRAAELGAEIGEPWVVANAAIYLWNYSRHLMVSGEYQCILPTFQSLVRMLQSIEYEGNHALLVLLCDAVARGLIQPLYRPESSEKPPSADKSKSRPERGVERSSSVHGYSLDSATLQDVRKALELCSYAINISSCNSPQEMVPIAARKQVIVTWVHIKRLMQQQIGSKMSTDDECHNEEVWAMTRVLVGVEMLQCNRNPRHMEFSVPALQTLVSMASECVWTDAVVELQVWCQLAAFCHDVRDHGLVLHCTEKALQLEEAAAKCLDTMPFLLYGLPAVNEMLSSAACLRGLSLVHESAGGLHDYNEAMDMLLFSVRNAAKAENAALCAAAARHYWNSCLPLTHTAEERRQLKQPLETILNALIDIDTKSAQKPGKVKGLLTLTALPFGSSIPSKKASDEEDLTLRAAIYSLLLHIHIDRADWKGAMQVLDSAVRTMPRTRHRLPLLKHRIKMYARLGESVAMDMQKLQEEGEQCCSCMWHQVALSSRNTMLQLTCYQKSLSSFMIVSAETMWQKVSLLLEFGEWLFSHNFPRADAQQQVEWAIDILVNQETQQEKPAEDDSKKSNARSGKRKPLVGVQGFSFVQSLSSLKEVQRLDSLVQAHTLLAFIADRTSPEHQQNLLRAYTFVLQIWQVSMVVICETSLELAKSQPVQAPPPPSAGSKKGAEKSKEKTKAKDSTSEETLKPLVLDQALPQTVDDWARYSCPNQARQILRTNSSPNCINKHSIMNQAQSLFYLNLLEKELHSLSLSHLTLPITHLAEIIAHDLLDRKEHSDLYRLRIVRTCCQLGLETHSPYNKYLLSLSRIQEEEQMGCRRAIALSQERKSLHKIPYKKAEMNEMADSWQQSADLHSQDIWLEKAEVCLSLGLYQPARLLLAEAHLVASELGDKRAMARSMLSLAVLACEEQNHPQALLLLDKAHALGGDEDFWYQFTVTKVRAAIGSRDKKPQIKTAAVVKQGCEILNVVLQQQVNQVPRVTFLITSLEMRGAMETTRSVGGSETGKKLSSHNVEKLKAACEALSRCASGFTKLSYREHAAKSYAECTQGLRILASAATGAQEKQRFLLQGISYMKSAIMAQEHVVLNLQSLLPPPEESRGMRLLATQTLLQLRMALADFCLTLLKEQRDEEKCQALAREWKTPAEIALEEFACCTPEPNSIEQEWLSTSSTLGQVALNQLSAVSSHCLDNVEIRARCLTLMGKSLRLLAMQEDPIYLSSLWERDVQKEACADPKAAACTEEESAGRKEQRTALAKSADPQRNRRKAQQLLMEAKKVLAEAASLCLNHRLPASILADASLNMLECHGVGEPVVVGQYLALFQSCCTVAVVAEVLSSACPDASMSQVLALLSLHRNLLLSEEERPSSMLKKVEDSLKTFGHLTVNPNHLSILADLPPNLKILLLQHSDDGSELYGALYELSKTSENHKGKSSQHSGTPTCSRVAKVSVCPQALLVLQEQARAFRQETGHTLLKEACWHSTEGTLDAPEDRQTTAAQNKLTQRFGKIVRDMEDYMNPLVSQFEFTSSRTQDALLSEMNKAKDKDDKLTSEKLPMEVGEFVVLLADRNLLELPLEALSLLQEEGLSSVSRDFSLQLLHSRLQREEGDRGKVESDNKKETKGGKGTKGKTDQSQSIKAGSSSRVSLPHTFPVNSHNFRYIVNSCNDNNLEGANLGERMMKILETQSQNSAHLWEGSVFSKHTPSLCELEQLLCKCSGFIYLGMDRFMANIPPAKRAALNLSDCRMALLFELVQNSALRQSSLDMNESARQSALRNPTESALLLSLHGVSCVFLNQWNSSLQQSTKDMIAILDNLLRVKQTSGQTIHVLRKDDAEHAETPYCKVTQSSDQTPLHDSKDDALPLKPALTPSSFNCILYGLPNLFCP